jgi:hypothetical protein
MAKMNWKRKRPLDIHEPALARAARGRDHYAEQIIEEAGDVPLALGIDMRSALDPDRPKPKITLPRMPWDKPTH